MKLKGIQALVVGMKKSGMASAALLAREGARVRATDLKPLDALPGVRELNIPFAQQTAEVFESADLIVLSPDVPADLGPLVEARGRGVPVIGEVELAAEFLKGRTIGITGSNGKTTTTSLTGHILRESGVTVQVGGNIGLPVTAMIDTSREDGWNVLELSSFQLETIVEFRAHIAVALNVTQNHLDRHHTLENYAAAKGRLLATQRRGDFAVLNADDAVCVGYAAGSGATAQWFSSRGKVEPGAVGYAAGSGATAQWFSSRGKVEPGAWLSGDTLILDGQRLMPAGEIPIRGRHNVENVLAASIAAARAGFSHAGIAAAVRTFRAVEHRLEFVRSVSGVEFYNDSKATSVDATLKAVDAFGGGLWVILGGKDKGLEYTALRAPLAAKAHAALLIGAAAAKIADQLQGAVPLVPAGTIEAAIAHAYAHAVPGDTVLLAPACASFDQFQSYEHRGQFFKQIVNQLQAKD